LCINGIQERDTEGNNGNRRNLGETIVVVAAAAGEAGGKKKQQKTKAKTKTHATK
jgi:hypothetical protein